jgi:hypothetical protein
MDLLAWLPLFNNLTGFIKIFGAGQISGINGAFASHTCCFVQFMQQLPSLSLTHLSNL